MGNTERIEQKEKLFERISLVKNLLRGLEEDLEELRRNCTHNESYRTTLDNGNGEDNVGKYDYEIIRCEICDITTVTKRYGGVTTSDWTEHRFKDPHLKEFLEKTK